MESTNKVGTGLPGGNMSRGIWKDTTDIADYKGVEGWSSYDYKVLQALALVHDAATKLSTRLAQRKELDVWARAGRSERSM